MRHYYGPSGYVPLNTTPAKAAIAPEVCSLCVEHFPDKSPSPMELNRVGFACRRQHSLDDHIDNWPLYGAAPELLEAVKDALAFLDRPDITTYEWYKLAPEHVGKFRRAIAKAEGR